MKTLWAILVLILTSPWPVDALDNGLARTPPMGWSGWNAFYGWYDEKTVVEVADAMATNGMLAAGYDIVSIDVGWMLGRDVNGAPIINTERFPHGLKWLGDYLHAKGFKFGVYGMIGTWNPTNRCDPTGLGRGGSVGFEDIDAALWASWGADYLKYDLMCPSPNSAMVDQLAMRDALERTGRPIIYMLSGGYFEPYKVETANLWRTYADIYGSWTSVMTNADINCWGARYAKPGAWNDPDMLEIGNGYLTLEEEKSHFALWCIMAAPLIAGNDVRSMSSNTLHLLTARELIAVDQDPAGVQGAPISKEGAIEIWCKPLGFSGNEQAVVLLNRGMVATNITVHWTNILLQPGLATVRDLWARTNLGTFTNSFSTSVPPHGCAAIKISGVSCGAPVFLSDLPFANLPSLPNENGLGDFLRDTAYSGRALRQDNIYYPKGLATVAPSRVSFLLSNAPGTVTRFVSDIGLDDGCGDSGSAVFQVWADGQQLYESGLMTNSSPGKSVNLDVTGRSVLTLITTDFGDGSNCDVASWFDARILQAPRRDRFVTISRRENAVRIQWHGVTGTNYRIRSSPSPNGLWVVESPLISGNEGILTFDFLQDASLARFFRVDILDTL